MPGAGPPPCTTASRNRRRPAAVGCGAACCIVSRMLNESRKLPPRSRIAPSRSCALIRSPTARVWPMQSSSGELTTWCPRMPVEGAGSTAALDVAQDRDPGVLAESLLEQPLDVADRDPLAVAVLCPFGDQHHVLPAALVASGAQDRAHHGRPVVPLRR